MSSVLQRFLRDESGATALEYAVIAVMVSITIVAGAKTIGTGLSNLYFDPLKAGFE